MKAMETENYSRITKSKARKVYEGGGSIYLLPCRMHPENHFQAPVLIRRRKYDAETGQPAPATEYTFEKVVNAFEYYNCDSGRGYYAAFYRKK